MASPGYRPFCSGDTAATPLPLLGIPVPSHPGRDRDSANQGHQTGEVSRQRGKWPLLQDMSSEGWLRRVCPAHRWGCRHSDSEESTPADGLKQGGQRTKSDVNGAKGSCSRMKGLGRTECTAEAWGSQSRAADSSRLEAELPREGAASLPLLPDTPGHQRCTTCPPFKTLFGHPGSLPLFSADSQSSLLLLTPGEGVRQVPGASILSPPYRGECDAEEDRSGCSVQASSGDQTGGGHFLHQDLHHRAYHGDQLQDRRGV